MAEIDTSLAYALWNGQMANCFIRSAESESAPELPRKLLLRNSWNIYFPREGQMLSREDGFPVVEAVYNERIIGIRRGWKRVSYWRQQ